VTVTLKVAVTFGLASLQIQRQQLLQNLLIRQSGLPAIGGEDGFIHVISFYTSRIISLVLCRPKIFMHGAGFYF